MNIDLSNRPAQGVDLSNRPAQGVDLSNRPAQGVDNKADVKPDDNENIIVLDPATTTGYCICSVNSTDQKAEINEYGFFEVDISSEYQGDHCIDLMEKIKQKIILYNIKNIGIEDYFYSSKFKNGCNVNGAFRTAIHILARTMKIKYVILSISLWKKHIAGRSIPTKAEKEIWKKNANKYFIQHALYKKWNIKFPNHSIRNPGGKIIAPKSDIVDSVAMSIYFMQTHYNIKNIISTVVCPPDTLKKFKNSFVYE
jgi:Holliday junction resolvasome RuvABC endonuclease subunit